MSTVTISMRVPESDLAEIDERAQERGVTRTAFLLAAALDRFELGEGQAQRFAEHEVRLFRLERQLGIIPSRPSSVT